jgi:hypothetical protein
MHPLSSASPCPSAVSHRKPGGAALRHPVLLLLPAARLARDLVVNHDVQVAGVLRVRRAGQLARELVALLDRVHVREVEDGF